MSENELPKKLVDVVVRQHVDIVYADWLIAGTNSSGVVSLALAAVDHTASLDGQLPQAVLTANLRMSESFARFLHSALGQILQIDPPTGETQPKPQTPPRNFMN